MVYCTSLTSVFTDTDISLSQVFQYFLQLDISDVGSWLFNLFMDMTKGDIFRETLGKVPAQFVAIKHRHF